MYSMPKIIHIDMDAFYASVEQRNNPALKGKPVIVGGRPNSRGVVSTCSYEARRYGIHSAMPTSEAYRRCPHAVFISHVNFDEYRRVSEQIHGIFKEVTDIIEPLSLDEAYLDVSDNKLNEASATRVAEWLRGQIRQRLSLTASAGVSYNKSLAKIASDWNKPDGLMVIPPEKAEEFLTQLPIGKFFGIGPVTAAKMKRLGINTGGDLRDWPIWKLTDEFGKNGSWFYNLCRGIDTREVVVERERKSLGRERTFETDMTNMKEMEIFLSELAVSVWQDLQDCQLSASTVMIKVKYADFHQVTRQRTLKQVLPSVDVLQRTAIELLREVLNKIRPVRLLGLSMSSFAMEERDDDGWLDLG